MARTKLKPLFTTDTRNNSKTADKSRTFTGVDTQKSGRAFTFLNAPNARNKKSLSHLYREDTTISNWRRLGELMHSSRHEGLFANLHPFDVSVLALQSLV